MAKDPFYGVEVDPTTAQHASEYRRQTYSFCASNRRALDGQQLDRLLQAMMSRRSTRHR